MNYANRQKCSAALGLMLAALMMSGAGCGPTNGLPPLSGEFVYVSNSQDGLVSEFEINTATGALTFTGAVPTSPNPGLVLGLVVHPTNEFLYIADEAADVYGWDIGDGGFSGRLFARNSAIPAINGPAEGAIDPALQKCLYVTNSGGIAQAISRYSIDLKSGLLTSLGSTKTGAIPLGIAITPKTGAVLLNANLFDGTVNAFAQSGANCGLTLLDTVTIPSAVRDGAQPDFVAFNPLTFGWPSSPAVFNFAYVTDSTDGRVQELTVTSAGATLAASVAPGIGTLSGPPAPFSIAVHPSGSFVYTGSPGSGAVSLFDVDTVATDATAGELTWISNTTGSVPSPVSLAIEPMGKYLYAANSSNSTITEFSIDPITGALTLIGTVDAESPANPGSGPISIVTTN